VLDGGVGIGAGLGADLLDAFGDDLLEPLGGFREAALGLARDLAGRIGDGTRRGLGVLGGGVDGVRGHSVSPVDGAAQDLLAGVGAPPQRRYK
jgi:hypothetical protein